jgi:hypothetical protein
MQTDGLSVFIISPDVKEVNNNFQKQKAFSINKLRFKGKPYQSAGSDLRFIPEVNIADGTV